MSGMQLTPFEKFANLLSCGWWKEHKIVVSFKQADIAQSVIMAAEVDLKGQIARLTLTREQQKHAWALSGGTKSTSQRTISCKAEYMTTCKVIDNKSALLATKQRERNMNEIALQQCHDAVESQKTRDNPISRLLSIISIDSVVANHDLRMRQIEDSHELTHVIDANSQDIADAMAVESDPIKNDDAERELELYEQNRDDDEVKEFDSNFMDVDTVGSKADRQKRRDNMCRIGRRAWTATSTRASVLVYSRSSR